MGKAMSVAETKKNFTQVLRKLKEPLTVTRHGEPVAIILSIEGYKQLSRRFAYDRLLRLREALPEKSMSATEAFRLARKELEERGDRNRR